MVSDKKYASSIEQLEKQISFNFVNKQLALQALTHRSFIKEESTLGPDDHNERLEFLGDAVLGLVAAQEIFEQMPHASEGILTQLRALYVCQSHLAEAGRKIGLGSHIRVAKAMRMGGPIDLPSILSDVLEAIFGAAYLDQGFTAAKGLILHTLGPTPTKALGYAKDAKTELQEHFQASLMKTPIYTVVSISGPAHAPIFVVDVSVENKVLARGEGSSKKDAAQQAAKIALATLVPPEKEG